MFYLLINGDKRTTYIKDQNCPSPLQKELLFETCIAFLMPVYEVKKEQEISLKRYTTQIK